MSSQSVPEAGSLYAGIRATITRVPGRDYGYIHLSSKASASGWSEWDSVLPALMVDLGDVATTREALEALARAILEASEDL
jgi:hypothetical protein